jgi:uncharacterized phage protein (TIGR02218 family)
VRTIPAGFRDADATELQVCWHIMRRDGVELFGTECDEDLTVTDTSSGYAGTYLAAAGITGSDIRSTAEMDPDNLEVTGALQDEDDALYLLDLTASDLEAGLFDNAAAVTFLVKASDPDLYQHVLRCGWLGHTVRTAEGQYRTELRGLTQALSQTILRSYSTGCQWELFDENCKVDPAPFTLASAVASTGASRRAFDVTVGLNTQPGQVPGGKLTWTSGLNTGYQMEVKTYADPTVGLYLPMTRDIAQGDEFTFRAGCDKAHATCMDPYANVVNFGGWAIFVPGMLEVLKQGKR